MIVSGVAGRFALALHELATEQRNTDEVAGHLRTFEALMAESPDLVRLVRSPAFNADQQVRALGALMEKVDIGGLTANFIKLVASKRRLFAIGDMIKCFFALDDQAKGVLRAQVTVAEPLSDRHQDAISDALREISGGKSVEMSMKVDPSIIGGLIVKLGSRMVDASLKTKLNSIRMLMKEVG